MSPRRRRTAASGSSGSIPSSRPSSGSWTAYPPTERAFRPGRQWIYHCRNERNRHEGAAFIRLQGIPSGIPKGSPMWLILFRVFMVALLAHAGYFYTPIPGQPWAGATLGVVGALFVIVLETKLRGVPAHHLVGALVGGVTGLIGARLVWGAMEGLDLVAEHFIHALLIVFLVYMGLVIGTRKGEWLEPARIIAAFKDSQHLRQYKVLDTYVIIDRRIADICETGI